MATSSLKKDFTLKEQKSFERLKKDIEENSGSDRTVSSSKSLERGKESLKHFSFR